jgi:RTX calcium-binding nonapeptide repeat (4 copies)
MGLTPRAGLTSAATFAAVALIATPVHAATYTVTRSDDPAPPQACNADCSLREAVLAANSTPGTDAIRVPGGTYTLSIPGQGGPEGDLDITRWLSIATTGPGSAIIDANRAVTGDRVIEVHSGATFLFGVGVVGGLAPADGDGVHRGGGIRVDSNGRLAMLGGQVRRNSTTGAGQGGGIYNAGVAELLTGAAAAAAGTTGIVDFGGVVVDRNRVAGAGGMGGGIYTAEGGHTVVDGSRLSDNDATLGGALYDLGAPNLGGSQIFRSLFSNNSADVGGAVFEGTGGSLTLHNTTIEANNADVVGGALRSLGGTALLKSSTVTSNVAGTEAGGIATRDGAGGEPASVTLHDTIVAENTDLDDGAHPDCFDRTGGRFHTDGYNILGVNDGCGLQAAVGDQIGTSGSPVDPGLVSESRFAGGFQPTWPIEPTSGAVDAGDPSPGACEPEDARGVPRGLGGRCDIGAYELTRCQGVLVNRVGTRLDESSATLRPPVMTPTSGSDGLLGLGGNDHLDGDDGNDGLCGGKGNDVLNGGEGGDSLAGTAHDDVLKGSTGPDRLLGGRGGDRLKGGRGRDVCTGGPGHDIATGCEVKRGIP